MHHSNYSHPLPAPPEPATSKTNQRISKWTLKVNIGNRNVFNPINVLSSETLKQLLHI